MADDDYDQVRGEIISPVVKKLLATSSTAICHVEEAGEEVTLSAMGAFSAKSPPHGER